MSQSTTPPNHIKSCRCMWLPALFAILQIHEGNNIGVDGIPHHIKRPVPRLRASGYEKIKDRSCFRNLDGMMNSMFDLEKQFPNLVSISDIGDSYLKNHEVRNGDYDLPAGYDIFALNITASDSSRLSTEKGKMLVTSGVHAREYAPPELLARFIEMLAHNYNDNADITWILQHTEIHAIIYVNPDGRYMAENYPETYWRKNLNPGSDKDGNFPCSSYEYGTDINRNFDFMWADKRGASSDPCMDDFHGTGKNSESETEALVEYAKRLFPEGQRKIDPEAEMDVPFGEDITGMYIDIHASGGYVYYPWGHKDEKSPDDEALQALGRKISYFNGYKLWAGSQPDFQYEASGDTSDYMYAAMGVASLGFEIGEEFYEDCDRFEDEIVPINLPALIYSAKIAQRPFSTVKGPDILDMKAVARDGKIEVEVVASDGKMVNTIKNLPNFRTGNQIIKKVQVYLDVHPDDSQEDDFTAEMRPMDLDMDSGDEKFGFVLHTLNIPQGRHTLFAQAMDSDGYLGPVSSVFFDVGKSGRLRRPGN